MEMTHEIAPAETVAFIAALPAGAEIVAYGMSPEKTVLVVKYDDPFGFADAITPEDEWNLDVISDNARHRETETE